MLNKMTFTQCFDNNRPTAKVGLLFIIISWVLTVSSSCSENESSETPLTDTEIQQPTSPNDKQTILYTTISNIKQTRVSASKLNTEGDLSFYWDAQDSIDVFTQKNGTLCQSLFVLSEGEGTEYGKCAQTSGEYIDTPSTRVAIYPALEKNISQTDTHSVPLALHNNVQDGDDTLNHLKESTYLISSHTNENIHVPRVHVAPAISILSMHFKTDAAITPVKCYIRSAAFFTNQVELNLLSGKTTPDKESHSHELSMKLKNIENKKLWSAHKVIWPIDTRFNNDLSNNGLLFEVETEEGERYVSEILDAINWQAGKQYVYKEVYLKRVFKKRVCSTGSKHASESQFPSYDGLAMTGYQGWFNCESDGAGLGWKHYSLQGLFDKAHISIDMWPDMSEYTKTYKTPFSYSDGSTATLFSSYDKETTDVHFRWMKEYDIDGAFVQCFASGLKNSDKRNHQYTLFSHILDACETYNRAVSIMYDLSGMQPNDVEGVKSHWKYLVDELRCTSRSSNNYLYHNGKPLVALWGAGFKSRTTFSYEEVNELMDFFLNDPNYGGCAIMLGVPTHWRNLNKDADGNPLLYTIIRESDIIMTWMVGRHKYNTFYDFCDTYIVPDLAWCKENGIGYCPDTFPGSSNHNLDPENNALNGTPRENGRFLWRQIAEYVRLDINMFYYGMFDEVDEGTAFFKVTNNYPRADGNILFTGIGAEESDYYLWLAGMGRKMLNKEIAYSREIPTR